MPKQKPYLSFSHPPPGVVGFLFKKAAEKNTAMMRGLTVEEHREAQERLADVRFVAPGTRVQALTCAGVPCEWVYRDDSARDSAILYLHGGSWAYGTLRTARPVAMMLSAVSGRRVLVADYRLSPEHPYPAGAEDCATAYQWLCGQGYAPEKLALFGDSAGGNLSLSLLHRLHAQGMPMPAAVGLASPVTDLTPDSAFAKGKPDLLYTRYAGREQDILSLYCGEHDRRAPQVSPVFGNLDFLPPVLIHVGQDEHLCIDCDVFAQKAYEAGAPVTLKVWRGMYHDFTIVGAPLRESRQSLLEFGRFFIEHMN